MGNIVVTITSSRRILKLFLLFAVMQLVTSIAVQAQEISAKPTVLRLTPAIAHQREQIAALTPNLGTCAIARMLADEINREAASLVQTLNSASRLPLKTTGKRNPEELRSITKLKDHEEHLRGLEIRLTSLEPCPQTEAEKSSRLKAAKNQREMATGASQAQADKADEHKKNAQDHNKTLKDAVRKMLEQIAEINRATNL
jgi:hypothetical protein